MIDDTEADLDEMISILEGDHPDKDGFHFVCSTYNDEGVLCETWGKTWHFLGMTVLYEIHGEGCSCSYCKEFDGRRGFGWPRCRCRNAWRIFFWRKHDWPCQLSLIRWTLPRYPFVWWRCRYCKSKERKRAFRHSCGKVRF